MPPRHLNTFQRELSRAFQHAELTSNELWLRYFALGGDAGPTEVDAYLNPQPNPTQQAKTSNGQAPVEEPAAEVSRADRY